MYRIEGDPGHHEAAPHDGMPHGAVRDGALPHEAVRDEALPHEADLMPGVDMELVTVEFSPSDRLPDVPLRASAGPVNAALVAAGVRTTAEAARWLLDLPYGHNVTSDPLTVFREGCGTCVTKHAAYLTATSELGLEPSLVWGIYALTDEIVSGVGAVLERHGLPFVPTIHCFIDAGDAYVDLTEGNCNGKNRQINDYLRLVRVPVGADEEPHRATIAEDLCRAHPGFAGATPADIRRCLAECHEQMVASCASSAPGVPA